jgi:transposase InsO family protein
MRHKNEVLSILLSFHSYVATQHRLPILALQTDNGKEFNNFTLRSFFSAHDIHLRLSCPYTSPQNGKADRTLRTLNNSVRTMLMQSQAPPAF